MHSKKLTILIKTIWILKLINIKLNVGSGNLENGILEGFIAPTSPLLRHWFESITWFHLSWSQNFIQLLRVLLQNCCPSSVSLKSCLVDFHQTTSELLGKHLWLMVVNKIKVEWGRNSILSPHRFDRINNSVEAELSFFAWTYTFILSIFVVYNL